MLLIPPDAQRFSPHNTKCRTNFAKVLAIYDQETNAPVAVAFSDHDRMFTYRVGKTVKPRRPFCWDPNESCESGIHFFLTEKLARDYR